MTRLFFFMSVCCAVLFGGGCGRVTPPLLATGVHAPEYASFYGSVAPVKINNKWGFINRNGKLIIPCVFDSFCASLSTEGLYEIQVFQSTTSLAGSKSNTGHGL